MTNEHDTPQQSCDVVVVGAGLAGLTAATTAARAGAAVTLVDGRVPGGRARSATRDGYLLNEGGHALYRGIGGMSALTALGVRIAGNPPDTAGYRVLWDDEIAPLPTTPRGILTSRLLGTRSKMKLGGWFADIEKTAASCGDGSLGEWLDAERARADLRKYVLAVCRLSTYSARPEDRPAAAMLGQLAGAADGVVYVDGGWQSIVDELVRVAEASGVRIADHAPVTDLDRERGRWVAATPRGVFGAATVVLAAGGPAAAVSLLGDDAAGWVDRAGPAQRAACLDVGGPAGAVDFLLSADGPLYLSAHAPVAELAPAGRHLYSLMHYLDPGDPGDPGGHRAALEEHAARAGLPASEDRDVERFLAAPVVSWGSPQVGVDPPTGHELADRGILAAGDWVGRPLLADASILSGVRAGRAAAERARVAA